MKIVEIREKTDPISSPIRNAYIDFSKMTLSLVAVVTDVMRDGKPVVGYGFNSNGRYGQGGLIRDRFRPRVLEADPASLLDETGDNLDPHKVWAQMMINEKPGGHGERSVAVGTIDMAVWDAVAKIANKPLYQLLAERYGTGTPNPRVFVYAAGGYYYPGKGLDGLRQEMESYLARGYTVVKMKIGGASLADDCERIESVLKILGPGQQLAVDANGRFDLKTAIDYGKALSQYPLFWYEEAGDPLDYTLQAELGKVYAGRNGIIGALLEELIDTSQESKSAIAALTFPAAPAAIIRVVAIGTDHRLARNAARTSFSGGWSRTGRNLVWNLSVSRSSSRFVVPRNACPGPIRPARST